MWFKLGSIQDAPLSDLEDGGHCMIEIDMNDPDQQAAHAASEPSSDWRDKAVRELKKKQFLIARLDGKYYVTSNACPHALLPLDEGEMKAGCITCPFHGYTYNVKSGINIDMPDDPELPTFTVRVAGGILEVEVEV